MEQPRWRGGRPWNNSYFPDKTEPSLWGPDCQKPFKQDMNKQLSEETNLNDNGDWDIKVLARILLNRCEGNSRTPYLTGIAQGPSEEMVGCRNFSYAYANLCFWIPYPMSKSYPDRREREGVQGDNADFCSL